MGRAKKAESLLTGKKVVNPGILRNPGSLVTQKLANGMKFLKRKVSTSASHKDTQSELALAYLCQNS